MVRKKLFLEFVLPRWVSISILLKIDTFEVQKIVYKYHTKVTLSGRSFAKKNFAIKAAPLSLGNKCSIIW
jgi:hypothetical protein